jgi:hypothetical protein
MIIILWVLCIKLKSQGQLKDSPFERKKSVDIIPQEENLGDKSVQVSRFRAALSRGANRRPEETEK